MTEPSIAAILLTVAGAVACYLLARERFDRIASAIATAGLCLGSGVAWYASGSDDPVAAIRFAGGAVVAYTWVRTARTRAGRSRWLGAAVGLAGGIVAALFRSEPQALTGTLAVADVLWSSRGGLLATSPAVYLSMIGLVLLLRDDRVLASVALTLVAFVTLYLSAHAYWWGSAWPAPAPFVALTPYFVCGAAAVVDAVGRAVARRPALAAGALFAPLIVWNLTLMQAAAVGSFHLGDPVSFGDVGAAQARALHRWIGHLPSVPANLAYGFANGVHPSAYDLLASSRLLAAGEVAGTIDIGERDAPFVGRGWHGPERDGARSFRWATRSVIVAAPLDRPADTIVDVVARPYQPPNRPPQQLTLVVNGVAQEPMTLGPGWQPATFRVPQAAWRTGVNELELRFAYDAMPAEAGQPDGRALAASVDAITVRLVP
jgi:hypothetical protein